MVDGVHGSVDHVVSHVTLGNKIVIEVVTILHLNVMEEVVPAHIAILEHVNVTAVLVRL